MKYTLIVYYRNYGRLFNHQRWASKFKLNTKTIRIRDVLVQATTIITDHVGITYSISRLKYF